MSSASLIPQAPPFERLLLPVLPAAYGLAFHLTRNPADAEDLVQEASLQAFRGFGSFQVGSNFKAWYFRILHNCFVSRYRRARKERWHVSLEDLPESASPTERTPGPAEELLRRLDTEQVAGALGDLPDEFRDAATLYFIEDFSYQEIADILGVPLGTVRSRLHRGRKLLRRALQDAVRDRGA